MEILNQADPEHKVIINQIDELDSEVRELGSPPYKFDKIIIGAKGDPAVNVPGNGCTIDFNSKRTVKNDEGLEELRNDLRTTFQPLMDFKISSIEFGFELEAQMKGERIYDLSQQLPEETAQKLFQELDEK